MRLKNALAKYICNGGLRYNATSQVDPEEDGTETLTEDGTETLTEDGNEG
jgi:hypothetical protein